MAKIRSGVLGNTRGKVAGVVGSQWKNVNYLREYVKPANPNTAAQQTQRGKMSDVVEFCKPLIGSVFNAYTDKFQKAMSGFNFFIKQSIAEFDGSPVYGNLKLTEGKLFAVAEMTASYHSPSGATVLLWDEAIGNNGALTDKVFSAVYDSSTGLWYFAPAEAARDDETDTVTLPTGLTFGNIEVWAWAIQYSGTLVNVISDSAQVQCTEG